MTPKEALENIKQFMKTYHRHPVDEAINEAIETVNQSLNEHEALKKDVARYFELESRIKEYDFVTVEDKQEYFRLHSKLSKVGKEE